MTRSIGHSRVRAQPELPGLGLWPNLEAFFSGTTNLWNRLLVIALEDVGLADSSLLLLVLHHAAFCKNDPKAAARCACLLARARKTRLNDWAAICDHATPRVEPPDNVELACHLFGEALSKRDPESSPP